MSTKKYKSTKRYKWFLIGSHDCIIEGIGY
jgi:hypothetical protein